MSALGMKITNFHYTQTVFAPPSDFVEYPKWVHMEGYPSEIAKDAEQEAALRSRPSRFKEEKKPEIIEASTDVVDASPIHILTGKNDEKYLLLQIAGEKNIKVDKRWKLDRLRATIERETANL